MPVVLAFVFSSGCGIGSRSEPVQLEAAADAVSDIAMSDAALERMSLPAGTAVLVPLDRNILELDADTLASFASEGSIEKLIETFVLDAPIDAADLSDSVVLRTVEGREFEVVKSGEVTMIGNATLIDLRMQNGVTLVVVDNLVAPP